MANKLVRYAKLCCVVATLLAAHAGTSAAACSSASLADYVSAATSCQVGGLGFSGFAVEPFAGATAQIDPDDVSLSPVAGGFALSSTVLDAAAGDLLGLRVVFRVDALAPLTLLSGGSVALGSAVSASGDGVITAILDAGAFGNAIAVVADGIADTPASFAASSPSSFFDVFYELGIDGGTGGSAQLGPELGRITFAVAAIPEAGHASLLLIGLLALPLAVRRTRASKQHR